MRKTFTHKHQRFLTLFLILIISSGAALTTSSAAPTPADKMKPEELIAKHLAAIGPADALAAAKSRVVVGDVKVQSKSSAVREIAGVAQLASDGDKVVLAMVFNSSGYSYEKAAYDNDKMTVALMESTGKRTALGDFLMSQEAVFKQGLIGGVLSSAWPLLNISAKNPKLSYAGTKKIDGRELHELKYRPNKGGGDTQISLFFDAQTFQHVRSEYQYTVSARMGARPQSSVGVATDTGSQTLNRYKLIEEFSDFKAEGQLILPHTYKIRLSIDALTSQLFEWTMNFSKFSFNEPIEASAFNVSSTR
ncbi:MAG TPA: hypothetical protein VJT09_02785 [Pyrinomonadaceae bacterium]|nr:hypothetical protein [Pyrinomonadaceae bacterium]